MKADREIKVRCSACGHLTRIPTVTNADRIRSMTDKDMAMFLRSLTECVRCPAWERDGEYDMRPCYTGKHSCSYMWLLWLKEEVKE